MTPGAEHWRLTERTVSLQTSRGHFFVGIARLDGSKLRVRCGLDDTEPLETESLNSARKKVDAYIKAFDGTLPHVTLNHVNDLLVKD